MKVKQLEKRERHGELRVMDLTLPNSGTVRIIVDDEEVLCYKRSEKGPWVAASPDNMAIAAAINRWCGFAPCQYPVPIFESTS